MMAEIALRLPQWPQLALSSPPFTAKAAAAFSIMCCKLTSSLIISIENIFSIIVSFMLKLFQNEAHYPFFFHSTVQLVKLIFQLK